MTCENAFELISASLDGELTAAEEAQLREHLAQCPACRALQAELTGLQAATQAELEAVAPPELKARIMENLPAQEKSAGKVVYWRRWGAMAAAVALVALGAWQLPRFVFDPADVNRSADVAPAADKPTTETTETTGAIEGPVFAYSGAADSADIDTDVLPDAGATYEATSVGREASPAPAPASGTAAPAAGSAITNNAAPRAQSPSTGTVTSKKQTQPAAAAPEAQSEDVAAPVPAQAESAQPDSVDVTNGQAAPQIVTTTAGDAPSAFSLPLPGDGPDEAVPTDSGEVQPLLQSAPVGGASAGGDIGGTGSGLLQSAPAPESGAVDDPPVESRMAKLDTALIPELWCGVLTLAEYEPAADYPLEVLEDGQRQYTLPAADFQALIETLDADGAAYELRTDGEDVSPDAPIGLVIVPGQSE